MFRFVILILSLFISGYALGYPSECTDGNKPTMKALYKANKYYFESDYRSAIKWYLEVIRVNPKECVNTGSVEAKNQLDQIKKKIGSSKYKIYSNLAYLKNKDSIYDKNIAFITNRISVPIRADKSFGDNVIISLSSGTKLNLIQGDEGGWSKISANGISGWIISRYIKLFNGELFVTDEVEIPIRSDKSIGDNILYRLKGGSKVYVIEGAEDGWSKIKKNGAVGWVISKFLTTAYTPIAAFSENNPITSSDSYSSNSNRVYSLSNCISMDEIDKYECDDGSSYYSGKGLAKEGFFYPDHLIESITITSIDGSPEMLYIKGLDYFNKWKTREEGFELINKSANKGNSKAQHMLGDIYSMNGNYGGLSINYSDENAFKWYKKSANQGHALSQYEVGSMYHYGEGVSKSYTEAIKWYSKAAIQNQADAQYELGQIYANGQGVLIDYKKAIRWYSMAAAQNDTRASNKVKKLSSVKRLLKAGFTQQEISEYAGIQNKKAALNFGYTQQDILKSEDTFAQSSISTDTKDINLWLFNGSGQKNIVNRNNINKKVMDKTSPTIVTYNNSIKTTYDKYVVLAGKVLDDSKIAKLIINEKEYSLNGEKPGEFSITEYIQLGENKFNIYVEDVFGNNNTKVVSIHRKKPETANQDKKLLPPKNIKFKNPDAVALIIGVDNYESISNAPWAETDANVFYDFAQNALGIPNEKIKLITGSESSEAGIWKAVERWLPTEVNKNKSDLYVYFAGHGLASADGDKAYLIPWDGDPELLERTSILRSELIEGLKDLKPKSVTMFMDTCYSGRTKGGSGTLVADARGLRIVKKNKLNNLPNNFTLFSAAGNDETASSHPTLKHGLFSYWMMKGLGGDADSNNDKKITNAELYAFINKNVQKSAISMGRKQNPQMTGEGDRVISTW